MKRILILVGLVVVSSSVYLAAAHLSGAAFFTFGLPLGGDRGELRRISESFLEDVQFRDFDKAASYHSPEDQATVDIPALIWKLFQIKPEALDIMHYEVAFAKIDSSGDRGRVKMRLKAKELVNERVEEKELMLYFNRVNPSSPWHMKFEDSLRRVEGDKNKKH